MEIIVRHAKIDELEEVVRVEEETWPLEIRASREKFKSRMNFFPQGFFGAYVNGKMVAVSTAQIIRYPNKDLTSWERITDNGLIANSHTREGNALYIVSLGVSRNYQGQGLGSKLLEAQKNLARELGLQYLVLGARIPGYHKYSHLPIDEYLALRKAGTSEPLDPEIRFYERSGLEIAQIIPNYMEDDPESRNYGAVMIWSP